MLHGLTLKLKLAVGFGALLAALIAMGAVDYFSIRSLVDLSARADRMAEERYLVRSIQSLLNERKTDIRSFLLSADPKHMQGYQDCNRQLVQDFDQLGSLLITEQGKSLLQRLRRSSEAYDQGAQRVAQFKRTGKNRQATTLLLGPEMSKVRAEMDNSVLAFIEYAGTLKSDAREQQARAESRAKRLVFTLVFAGLFVGFVMATVTSRGVTQATAGMMTMIQEIAANNLALDDMEVTTSDELGRAGTALNTMKNNLRRLLESIARSAEQVASASEELSASATLQAQSADTQKGQVAQVSVAMQEMSQTVDEVSTNSSTAADASRRAAETAREGGNVVDETLVKMRTIAESVSSTAQKVEELGKSSDQIGRIIGVINDIADQTNLLALNAAIEAARAGEQGRGFAVVADEVRKLAERTTSATKEVAGMVRSIQSGTKDAVDAMRAGTTQVQQGVETTTRAGDSLKQIIHMSEQVGEMITRIATASVEQSSATEQVNQNVSLITRLVGESAAGAQEAAKACQDLSSLAIGLQKMVGGFALESRRRGSSWNRTPQEQNPQLVEQNPSGEKAFVASA